MNFVCMYICKAKEYEKHIFIYGIMFATRSTINIVCFYICSIYRYLDRVLQIISRKYLNFFIVISKISCEL
jgi:hypothetical protein